MSENPLRQKNGRIAIGPHASLVAAMAARNYAVIGGVLLVILVVLAKLAAEALDFELSAGTRLIATTVALIMGMGSVGLGTLFSWLSFSCVKYSFDEEANVLYVEDGLLPHHTNTIPMNLVYDCDCTAGALEMLFGSGTLVVRELNKNTHYLPFVPRPLEKRAIIMAKSVATESGRVTPVMASM